MKSILERGWYPFSDTNGDGIITISDVVNWLFFLSGDGFLYGVKTWLPGVAQVFELSNSTTEKFSLK
jgi:hypothetical protein